MSYSISTLLTRNLDDVFGLIRQPSVLDRGPS